MKNIIICTLSIFSFVLTTSAQSKFKSQRDSLEFEAAKTEIWSPMPKVVIPGQLLQMPHRMRLCYTMEKT